NNNAGRRPSIIHLRSLTAREDARSTVFSSPSVEAASHGQDERLRLVGFLQKIQIRVQLEILAHDVGAVTAAENDLEVGAVGPQFFGEFAAIHVFGHHEVGEQESNILFVSAPNFNGFHTGGRLQHLVAVFLEDAGDEFANGPFVLDQQDGFRAAANGDVGR